MGDATCRPGLRRALREFLAAHADELCDAHRPASTWRTRCGCSTARRPSAGRHRGGAALRRPPLRPCAAHFARVRAGLEALDVGYHRPPAGAGLRLLHPHHVRVRRSRHRRRPERDRRGRPLRRLVEMLGGPPTPGIGFGIGIERVLIACDAEGCFPAAVPGAARRLRRRRDRRESARDLTAELRRAGSGSTAGFDGRSMKSQIKSADRSGALVALVIGAGLAEGTVAPAAQRLGAAHGAGPARPNGGAAAPRPDDRPIADLRPRRPARVQPTRRQGHVVMTSDGAPTEPATAMRTHLCGRLRERRRRPAGPPVRLGGPPARARRAPGLRRPARPHRASSSA
jgi:hypothetical protein